MAWSSRPTAVPGAPAPQTGWAAVRRTWSDPARWVGVALAAAPSVVFVVVDGRRGLTAAIVAAGVAALLGLGLRLVRRDPVRPALIGTLVVAIGAVVAALTGEARGFFLVPAMVPFAVVLVCLVTLVVRRPLTGLILNRVTGGPPEWFDHPGLRRVHVTATWVATGVNVVNAAVQVVFYAADDTAVLAAAHIATGPVFATLVAVTVVAARRAYAADIMAAGPRARTGRRSAVEPQQRLVTYGSLSPGQPHHHELAGLDGRWLEGQVHGTFSAEGWGSAIGYPALVPDAGGPAVDVQVFESEDLPAHWPRLDAFEGSAYRRVTVTVHLPEGELEAQIYALAVRDVPGR